MTQELTREERTLMGHHVESSTKAATTYNRDSLLLIQSKIATVLNLIKDGNLTPDASRVERLSQLISERVVDDTAQQSSDSEFDDTQEVSIHSRVHLQDRPCIPVDEADEFTFVAHKLTGTIHVLKDATEGKLACGRRKTLNMSELEPTEVDAATAPFCIQCNAVLKDRA
eukprot:s1743_g25.t1